MDRRRYASICPVVTPSARAVVLLSGGLDSSTVLAIAKTEGFDAYALSFEYGQRHAYELEAARRVADTLGASDHVIARIDLRVFGGSALTERHRRAEASVARDDGGGDPDHLRPGAQHDLSSLRPWPGPRCSARGDIFIGVNAVDYSGYPDCRPEYIAAFERMANLAIKAASKAPGA